MTTVGEGSDSYQWQLIACDKLRYKQVQAGSIFQVMTQSGTTDGFRVAPQTVRRFACCPSAFPLTRIMHI